MNKELNISVGLPTKENIYQASMDIVQKVQDGEMDALELAVKLSAMEKIIETIRDGISENVLLELDKEQGRAISLGAKIQRKEVGTKYDYSGTQIWSIIKKQEDEIAKKRKDIEKMAQLAPEGTELNWTDTSTGETFTIVKAAKSSKTSFAVTLSSE